MISNFFGDTVNKCYKSFVEKKDALIKEALEANGINWRDENQVRSRVHLVKWYGGDMEDYYLDLDTPDQKKILSLSINTEFKINGNRLTISTQFLKHT